MDKHYDNGEQVMSEDFDYSKLNCDDRERGDPIESVLTEKALFYSSMATSFNDLIAFCLEGNNGKMRRESSIGRRLVAIAYCLNHRSVRNISLQKLGKELHCTRAALSKLAVDYSEDVKIKNPAMKSDDARAVYRETQLKRSKL